MKQKTDEQRMREWIAAIPLGTINVRNTGTSRVLELPGGVEKGLYFPNGPFGPVFPGTRRKIDPIIKNQASINKTSWTTDSVFNFLDTTAKELFPGLVWKKRERFNIKSAMKSDYIYISIWYKDKKCQLGIKKNKISLNSAGRHFNTDIFENKSSYFRLKGQPSVNDFEEGNAKDRYDIFVVFFTKFLTNL